MELTLIGIGSGNPDHLTGEAIAALGASELILIPSKSDEKQELALLREAICARFLTPGITRLQRFDMPQRDPSITDYTTRVDAWHDAIAIAWQAAVPPNVQRVALLVWGDPSLYDSSLRIAARLNEQQDLTVRVIPGLTSLQLLTAAHAIPLNDLAQPFLVTTGRRLRENGWPVGVDTVAVMLDGECSFTTLPPKGLHIWWGAYVGMPGQILLSGPLADTAPRILARRAEARQQRGWIMDIYLLRRVSDQSSLTKGGLPAQP